MLLALALAASLKSDWTPPARYNHPYEGKIFVRMVHPRDVPAACRALYRRSGLAHRVNTIRPDQLGCSVVWHDPDECSVVIIDRPSPTGRTPEELIRHELGHCNGWPSDHPD